MFETILVPLDGSELAEAALALATELRSKLGARLILLRAIEPMSHRLSQPPGLFESPAATAANVEFVEKMAAAERDEARVYLEALGKRLGGGVETLVVDGDAA